MDALPDLIVATIGALLTDVRDRCGLAVALCRNAPHLMVLSQDIPYCASVDSSDGLARRIDAVLRTCPRLNDLAISFPLYYDEAQVTQLAKARDRIGRRPRVECTIGMAWLAHVDVIDISELNIFGDAPLPPKDDAVPTAIINVVNFRERVRQSMFDAVVARAAHIGTVVFNSMAALDAIDGAAAFFRGRRFESIVVDERGSVLRAPLGVMHVLSSHVTEFFCGQATMRSLEFVASNIHALKALRRMHVDNMEHRDFFHSHYGSLARFFDSCSGKIDLWIGENMLDNPATEVFARLAQGAGMTICLHAGGDAYRKTCHDILAYKLGTTKQAPPDLAAWPGLALLFNVVGGTINYLTVGELH